jgi:23S rRNA (uracil1939-C5)-methyltransferase
MAAKIAERVELRIESIGARGDGLARLGGKPVFVPFTLPGERVVASLVGERGDGLVAEVLQRLEVSHQRVGPPCPHFGVCGGCALQHWSDESYANWKIELLRTALSRQGLSAPIEPLRRTPPHARRRAGFVLRFGARSAKFGFRERSSHRIIAVERCPVLQPSLERLATAVPATLSGLAPANSEWMLDAGATEAGIDLLITAPGVPSLAAREAVAGLAEQLDLARVSWRSGENAEPEPMLIRRTPILRFAGVAVEPPPGAFFQASLEGEAALTAEVLQMTAGARRVADLYAGIGTFSVPLARSEVDVLSVEGAADALGALARTARKSGLSIRTLQRDLARDPLQATELDDFDAVLFDPPRAGAKSQSTALASSKVPVVVAVSCNPATFARDARLLTQGGYRLERVVPVDQFLWSPHLELVALLRR